MNGPDNLFEQTKDEPVPGGCDRCDAYQTTEAVSPNVFVIRVHHDDWCPSVR